MKRVILFSILTISLAFIWQACTKKAESPPVSRLGWTHYTVEQLKAVATCTSGCSKRFTKDAYITGVVLADELNGNFYKEVYIRDTYADGEKNRGIHLDFTASKCNFFIGDSIRVNLKGLDVGINSQTGLLEIDSLDYEKNVVKYGSGPAPQPKQLTLDQLSDFPNYYCDLITVNNVGFDAADTAQIFADPILQQSLNRTLSSCNGNTLIVRTSNFAKFAQTKTPKGFGSITGIATAYQGTSQMAIRDLRDVSMNGAGCTIYLKRDFNDNSISSNGWTQQSVLNSSVTWSASSFSGAYFAKCSGYISGNKDAECWLISPSINLAASNHPILSFITAANFTGPALEVHVSTNYNSGAPSSATWTKLNNVALSTTGYVWTASGPLSLDAFKSQNVRIAFRYQSTTSGAATFEVDDVIVREN